MKYYNDWNKTTEGGVTLIKGTFTGICRMNRWGWTGYLQDWGYGVVMRDDDSFYLIRGEKNRNRALEGMTVWCVEDCTTADWTQPGADCKRTVWKEWLGAHGCLGEARIVCGSSSGSSSSIIVNSDRDSRNECGDVILTGTIEVESRQRLGTNKRGVPYYRFISDRAGDPPIRVASKATRNIYATVCISSWKVDSRIPDGHVERELGLVGSDSGERGFLQSRHDRLQPPWKTVLRKNPAVKSSLDSIICTNMSREMVVESSERLDLTHLPVFTIDPEGSLDLDDALHCLKKGTCGRDDNFSETEKWSVGIHIADVTSLYSWDGPLDRIARSRATSLYLSTEGNSMIPPEISDNAASLLEGHTRRAMTILVEVCKGDDTDYYITNVRLVKSWVKSTAAYTYDRVESRTIRQDILVQTDKLAEMSGAFGVDTVSDSHKLVEMMMLWANRWVAQKMWNDWNWGIFRIGSMWKGSDDRTLDSETQTFLEVYKRESAHYAVTPTSPVEKDQLYCHFTSPIRRYADCLVHRILSGEIDPSDVIQTSQIENILEGINTISQNSTRLHREWDTWKWITDKGNGCAVSDREEALVCDIDQESMSLLCYLLGSKKLVKVNPVKKEWEDYASVTLTDDNSTMKIQWKKDCGLDMLDLEGKNRDIKVMDKITVVLALFPDLTWKKKLVVVLD